MNEKEIIEVLEITLSETAQQMKESMAEVNAVVEIAQDFRKDYDKLMDAVHYLSVMYGTSHEADAMSRLQTIYTRLQNTWGG
jgi:hypothetical protein